jgi:hypothetical protein
MRHAFGLRMVVLVAWSVVLLGIGLIRDYNFPMIVLKEFTGFQILICMLLLGRRDEVWEAIRKPIVILFYISLVLVFLMSQVPAAILSSEGFVAGKSLQAPRALDTVAYFIRSIVDMGPLLFAWGMASTRKDIWRILMIGGLAAYVAVEVLLFEFRGGAVAAVFIVLVYIAISPLARMRIPVGPIIGVCFMAGIGFVIASQTKGFNELIERFHESGGFFDARIDEAGSFFRDMGPIDFEIGRGFAGTYTGPAWAPMPEYNGRLIWSTNHFGFLGLVLRGGFPFLLFMAIFLVPYFLPKPPGWYQSPYNVTAMIAVPWLMLNILINPLDFYPDTFFLMLMWGLCFSRLSTFAPET